MGKPVARTEGARLPVVRARGLRLAPDADEDSAQSGSIFDGRGEFSRELVRRAPAQHGERIGGARPPVVDRLRDGSAAIATNRRTLGTQDFSPTEIERL